MRNETYALRLLTPCFNGGANPIKNAELRVSSIRGQIRWWYRESFQGPQVERYQKILFGDVNGRFPEDVKLHGPTLDPKKKNLPRRSSVTFRITEQPTSQQAVPMLPHKGGRGGSRPALEPMDFNLLCRCREDTFEEVDRAVKVWVLLGGLGARSNRAAGSVWFGEGAPDSVSAFRNTLAGFNPPTGWDIRIARVDSFTDGRRIASDTVDGRPDLLGGIKPTRRPSPIKFKVIELGAKPHLLMFSPKTDLWEQAVDHLQNNRNHSPKPLTKLDWQPVL